MTSPSRPPEVPLIDRLRAATAGRYIVHAELGVGGMATVFRATEVALEREVAVKVMSAQMATTPGAFERFLREARVAAGLSHPHIVPIYAVGEDPALPWFAMKFIEGRGLDSILKKEGARPLDEVVRTIGVVGRALHHAHERGVVHRDVKPANIMVGNDGWVYVTDFGIAKRDDAQGLTQAGTVVGTPAYMSPEQFNGQAVAGAADQYALGVVAYEMLAGRTPFDAPSLGEIMRGHLLEPPPPLRAQRVDVPLGVAAVVNRMLEKEPARRYATLGEAVEALEEAAAGARPGARPATAARPSLPAQVSATTPIPRSNPAAVRSGAQPRNTSGVRVRPAAPDPEPRTGGSSILLVGLGLLAIAGLAWVRYGDQLLARTTPGSVLTAPAPDSLMPVAQAPESTAAPDTTGADRADSAPASAAIDSAINDLALRVATAVSIDAIAPRDSVVVRVGSQTFETVLFVNGEQLGILGGRGLVERTVAPGTVSLSVRKLNCQAWDTTFTGETGRRYTFVERSPRC